MKECSDIDWRNRALWLLLSVALLRALYNHFLYAFDLSGDEAYYWEWGRRIDWGYYSKPPLIGWLMGLMNRLGWDSPGNIRTASSVIGTGMLGLIFVLARQLFSSRTAFWVLLLSLATVGNAALNLCMTTDALLSTCWVGALLSFWRFAQKPTAGRAALWVLCLGIGALSKQMMWVFFPIAIVFLALCPEKRDLLKRPLLWVCGILPLLFTLPSILWNARNDWITFQHTSDHFGSEPFSLLNSLSQLGEFLGSQAGLMTPVIFVLLVVVWVAVLRAWRESSAEMRYLFVFSAPPFIGFLLFSLHRDVNPNWPLVFYLPALVLIAGACIEKKDRFERWMRRSVVAGLSLVVFFYAAMAILPLKGQDISRIAPLREVSHWSDLALKVAQAQNKLPEANVPIIVAGHRYYTAAIAFYHPERPRVYNWNNHDGVHHQYDLWPWENSFTGNALIVVSGDRALSDELRARFVSVESLQEIEIPENARKPKRATLYYAKGWKHQDEK